MIQAKPSFIFSAIFLTSVFFNTISAETIANYKADRDKFIKQSAKKKSPFSQQEMDIMMNAAKELAISLPDPGIKVGEKAPDFTLPDAYGVAMTLSRELKKGPVVLVFYRGAWCPFCNMHLHALQQALPEITRLNAQLILVTPQQPDKSLEQFKQQKKEFRVLSDMDSSVMKAYKLYYELGADLIAVYKKYGIDVEAFNGKGRNELPVPGSFVIAQDGTVMAMHADTDYKQRMEPADIIKALEAMK